MFFPLALLELFRFPWCNQFNMTSREEGLDESRRIALAIQQDAAAWESLVREHQQAVFRLAYLFTGDPDEAEDVAQEAFIHAFRAIHTFDAARPFRPWVLSIAANLARNRLRGLHRYLNTLQRFARGNPEKIQPTAPPSDAGSLWDQVRQLSLEDQQVIYLRYFLELSEVETAEAVRIPKGTVKSRLHRALHRLQERVEREHERVDRKMNHDG